MKISSSVMSVSWIPSESVRGLSRLGFEMGPLHYDEPPPAAIADLDGLEQMRVDDRFRFANRLEAWIEVEDGRIVGHGQGGGGLMGSTSLNLGAGSVSFAAVLFPELVPEPEVRPQSITFRQTVGGCTGVPAPRPVRHKPFVQFRAPTVWTTLALTLTLDGSSSATVEGASRFPRHWIYDDALHLAEKSGVAGYRDWFSHSFGERTPWGDHDSPTMMTAVETALERRMGETVMRGGKPKIRKVKAGRTLWEQGSHGSSVALLLDGILSVEVGGDAVATLGPGAVIGERAVLEGGTRTATLRAETPVRIAEASDIEFDRTNLDELREGHRREHGDRNGSPNRLT